MWLWLTIRNLKEDGIIIKNTLIIISDTRVSKAKNICNDGIMFLERG